MLLINCPFCGKRSEMEFIYGGPVKSDRPDPDDITDEEWVDYITITENPCGPVQERWWHARGCGEWVCHWRDTLTHEIVNSLDDK